MKLYLLIRTDGLEYDEFDAFVVAAENEENALKWQPSKYNFGWTSKENIKIEYIGESNSPIEKVIIASFNAG